MNIRAPQNAEQIKEEIAGVKKKRGCGSQINFALFLLLAIWLIANALVPPPSPATTPTPTIQATPFAATITAPAPARLPTPTLKPPGIK